jgi:uncharacterized repeat protein (TIGR02543 family)
MEARRPEVWPNLHRAHSGATPTFALGVAAASLLSLVSACGELDVGGKTDTICTSGAEGCPCEAAAPDGCEPGLSCEAGLCRAPDLGPDAGIPGDLGPAIDVASSGDSAGPTPPSCGTTGPLDPFCPCREDTDCASSVCLPVRDDTDTALCTRTCFDACPDGWSCTPVQLPGTDPTFMCVQQHLNLCRPCTTDAQCQTGPASSSGDRCVLHGDLSGSFCGSACEEDAGCPEGYACREARALENGATVRQCMPADPGASCGCSARATAEGAFTRCSYGDCQGTRTCAADGLTACVDPDGAACQLEAAVRVRFDAQGGTPVLPDLRELPLGAPYGALPDTTRAGHDFEGWWTEPQAGGERVFDSTVVTRAEPHVLYAAWAGTTAIVTFDPTGGAIPIPAARQVTFGAPYGGLPTTSREGYAFDGWWTTPAGAGDRVTPGTVVAIEGPHTLWARWTPGVYTVSFDPRGGSAVNPTTLRVTFGAPYGELPATRRPGYAFSGWNTEADGSGRGVNAATLVDIPRDHALFAVWKAVDITVTFDPSGGETPVPSTTRVTYAATYGPLAVTSRRGHVLDGWYTEPGGQGALVEPSTQVLNPEPHTLHAAWSFARLRVTFDADGGTQPIPGAREVIWGSPYGPLPATTREGYTFGGWHTGRDGGGARVEPDTAVDIPESHSLFARWVPNTYAVTFDAGEGDDPTPPGKTVTFGEAYGPLAGTSRVGYRFAGWSTAPDGAGVVVTEATRVSRAADHTLYAVWVAEEVEVRFDAAGGEAAVPASRVVTYDAPYGPLASTSRVGYDFGGWYTEPDGGGVAVTSASRVEVPFSHVLHAKWVARQLPVTFLPEGGLAPTPPSRTVTYDSPYGELAATSREGYTLAGWWTLPDGGDQVTPETRVANPAPHALYARWQPNAYTVTFSSLGAPPSPGSRRVTFGAAYGALATTTRDGYDFVGWWTAQDGGVEIRPDSTVTTAGNHTLYARWQGAAFTVTFDPDGGTAVDPVSLPVVFAAPYPVSDFPVTGRAGYTFAGWFTGRAGTGTRVEAGTNVGLPRDHTLFAHWTPGRFTVTFDASAGTPAVPTSRVVTFGAAYGELATTSRAGYRFVGWWTESAGGSEVTSGTVVATPRDHTLFARWEPIALTVTFNAGAGAPATPASKRVTFDAPYGDLATTSRLGFLFRGWWTSGVGPGIEVTPATPVSATTDHALFARWESACSSPCLNGGSCVGVEQCACVNGYTGPTCATPPVPPPGFVFVPPGTFNMGSPASEAGRGTDENQVTVTLTRGFFVSQREVTLGQWKARAGRAPSGVSGNTAYVADCDDTCPVIEVSWWSVLRYANALSAAEGLPPCYTVPSTMPDSALACNADWQSGRLDCGDQMPDVAAPSVYACSGYRLPTEAEWEFAARAGTLTSTPVGTFPSTCASQPSLDAIAWWNANRQALGDPIPNVVGTRNATGAALFDIFGNVSEWVWDRYPATDAEPVTKFALPGGADPQLVRDGGKRGLRGGHYGSCTADVRAAAREARIPGTTLPWLGFRLVRTAGP